MMLIGVGLMVQACAQPVEPRTFPALRLSKPPVIDGVVEPDEWQGAYVVEQFWSPSRQSPAEFPTRAYIGYDSTALYVAFICEAPDPAQIIAKETKRGGNVESDDIVGVLIDPQARGLEPYMFLVNPLGTQSEEIPQGTTENIRWRGDWQARARITPNGWEAELRIPFQVLRYPANQKRFGIVLERYVARLNEIYTFPNMGAFYSPRRQALWEGLELPPPRYPVILLPYFTGDSTSERTRSHSGLDVRYVAGDALTALLTFKPDFRNIAGDVAKVDFSYTEKVLAEQRPFFQEGSEFMPPRPLFYSLRVQELSAGFKAFGTQQNWRYGLMVGEYEQNGHTHQIGVARLRYQFAERSFLNLMGTRLQGDVQEESWGALLDAQQITAFGELRLMGAYYRLDGTRKGTFQQYTLTRNAPERRPNYRLQYTDIEPSYRPRLGFIPEWGYRGLSFGILWFDRPLDRRFLYTETRLIFNSRQRYGGARLDEGSTLLLQWLYPSQHRLTLVLDYLDRPPNIDRTVALSYGWQVLDIYRTGELTVRVGDLNGGRSWYLNLTQSLEPTRRLRARLDGELLEIRYASAPTDRAQQLIFTLNYEITPERAIGGRLVLSRSEFGGETETVRNFYLTYLQRVRQGFDLYLIYGLPNASRTQNRFALKVITPIEL